MDSYVYIQIHVGIYIVYTSVYLNVFLVTINARSRRGSGKDYLWILVDRSVAAPYSGSHIWLAYIQLP